MGRVISLTFMVNVINATRLWRPATRRSRAMIWVLSGATTTIPDAAFWALGCPLLAISRHSDGHAGTSALPPKADIQTPMSLHNRSPTQKSHTSVIPGTHGEPAVAYVHVFKVG